jgi:hypothetical protein
MLIITMKQPTGNQTTFFFYGAGIDPAAVIANLERAGLELIRAAWEV